jgi:hypothetical protein
MKALTICQPYATMIARGEKRVENRSWQTNYRGLLYIHAGKSRSWLQEGDEEDYPGMPFGAVVAVARLVACVNYDYPDSWMKQYPWLRDDEHAGGPWCWILDGVTPIGPWPWRGAQGLFDIDEAKFDAEVNRILAIDPDTHRATLAVLKPVTRTAVQGAVMHCEATPRSPPPVEGSTIQVANPDGSLPQGCGSHAKPEGHDGP